MNTLAHFRFGRVAGAVVCAVILGIPFSAAANPERVVAKTSESDPSTLPATALATLALAAMFLAAKRRRGQA